MNIIGNMQHNESNMKYGNFLPLITSTHHTTINFFSSNNHSQTHHSNFISQHFSQLNNKHTQTHLDDSNSLVHPSQPLSNQDHSSPDHPSQPSQDHPSPDHPSQPNLDHSYLDSQGENNPSKTHERMYVSNDHCSDCDNNHSKPRQNRFKSGHSQNGSNHCQGLKNLGIISLLRKLRWNPREAWKVGGIGNIKTSAKSIAFIGLFVTIMVGIIKGGVVIYKDGWKDFGDMLGVAIGLKVSMEKTILNGLGNVLNMLNALVETLKEMNMRLIMLFTLSTPSNEEIMQTMKEEFGNLRGDMDQLKLKMDELAKENNTLKQENNNLKMENERLRREYVSDNDGSYISRFYGWLTGKKND